MENSVKLIINAIPNKENMQEVQAYLSNMMPVMLKYDGKVVKRYKTIENLIGENSPEMIVVFEFPTAQSVKTMVASEGFKNLAESRAKAFTKLNLMICGEM